MPILSQYASVIIPNYNRLDALPDTFASLARQTLSPECFEVIFVDDGSSDGSLAFVEKLQLTVPYHLSILRQENCGPGAARNWGAQVACHELLVFWDSDMIADEHCLATHMQLQQEHGSAIVAGSRSIWPAACNTIFACAMWGESLNHDHLANKSPSYQDVLSSNLSIRRSDLVRLGGFNESLRAYEDTDLAYRAQQIGIPLVFSRKALGYHNHPMTLSLASRQQFNYQQYAVAFINEHPELDGEIRYLVDKVPIHWNTDSPLLIARKLVRQFIAAPGVLGLLEGLVMGLERYYPNPTLLVYLYWKVLASYQLRGFRSANSANRRKRTCAT